MSVMFIALPIALLLGAAGLFACMYCIGAGQYDDLSTPAIRILIDEQERSEDTESDDLQSISD